MRPKAKRGLYKAAMMTLTAYGFALEQCHAAPMGLEGQFAVSESGAATYSVAIQVPPGTAGLEPKLALTYNSLGGNGLLGVGWSLSGLSAIIRCPKTLAQDGANGAVNFNSSDRYCLDGQRLIAISGADGVDGTEYRTERESYSKVVSYGTAGNGPAWFKVWTKSGQIIEYGNTGDSRIEAIKTAGSIATWPAGTVRVWTVNRMSDTKGNYLTYSYFKDQASGEYYPSRVDYTGNTGSGQAPTNSVRFEYEARPDISTSYFLGGQAKATNRLKVLHNYAGTSARDSYTLSYSPTAQFRRGSRLFRIQRCAASNCLSPLELGFADDNGDITFNRSNFSGWGQSSGFPDGSTYPIFGGDWNGDGKSDFARVQSGGITFFLSNGEGSFTQAWTLIGWGPGSGFTDASTFPIFVGDWNGDGKSDFARVQSGGITFFLSNGDGSFTQAWTLEGWGPGSGFTNGNTYPIFVGDWNGDGKSDFARVQAPGITFFLSNGDGSFAQAWTLAGWGTGSSFTDANIYPIFAGDWNGDGKSDFARVQAGGITFFLSNGDGSFTQAWTLLGWGPDSGFSDGNTFPIFSGDWNGDGKADFARVQSGGISFFLSNGDGSFTQAPTLEGWGPSSGFTDGSTFPILGGDWNGDGKSDFARVQSAGIVFFLSNGDGTFTQAWTLTGWGPDTGYTNGNAFPIFGGDWNGDGRSDFSRVDSSGISFFSSAGINPYLVNAIRAQSQSVDVSYAPLTTSIYTKDTGAAASVYPKIDIQAPLYSVASSSQSNGIGGSLTTTYKYGGLKAEQGTGRGLLGFRWLESTQTDTGIVTRTEFRQDWPYVGLPVLSKKSLAGVGNGGVLGQTIRSYGCMNPESDGSCTVAPSKRYFAYVSQSVESGWETNGAPLPVITTASQYDAWGNSIQIIVSTTDGFTKTTTNTYAPANTTNWLLGRLTKATVTSSGP